jgi:L-malate glycosyltransferase
MKIGIHNEPTGGAVGGSEISIARLAEALARNHAVEILHHKRALTRDGLAGSSGTDLSAVSVRYVEPEGYSFGTSRIPWRRYRAARLWRASLSEPYDLFIPFVHGLPSFCHAPRGALRVLFPLEEPPYVHARGIKRAYHLWEWRRRLGSYQVKVANSHYTKEWAKRRWGIDCEVIYPPVDTRFDVEEKANLILSVGRFATQGHSKRQLEMLAVFNDLAEDLRDWEYHCVGSVDDTRSGQEYLGKARGLAEDGRARVRTNLERGSLKHLYQRSRIFWHAAGFGEDEEKHPEWAEHFGSVTVEAMAAGCVPIVIDRGGQREIVEHGVSGFLWSSLEELAGYTLRVARDEQLRNRVSAAARTRAQTFGTERFLSAYSRLLGLQT